MTRQTRLIRLPDGTPVWARIDLAGPAPNDGADAYEDGADTHCGPDTPYADTETYDGADPSYDGADAPGHGLDPYDDYQDVGAMDGALARVSRLREVITGVAASVRDAAERAAPDEIGVEFGVEFAVRGGAIVSVLADAQTTGTLKVTLTWKDRFGRTTPRPRPPVPDAAPSTVPPPAAPPGVSSTGGPCDA